MKPMSEDTKAILLLCGHLGSGCDFEPLSLGDYNQIVRWLLAKTMRPADLLAGTAIHDVTLDTGISEERLNALLKRGVKLGFAVEQWNQSGLWVVSRSDAEYPRRYKDHLKEKAPPLLFGAGDPALLQGGGLAIVGSRDVDDAGQAFASDVARWCARGGLPVISGGARGVDQIAMASALDASGIVIGVLADTLLRRSVTRDARNALADGRLLLVSPYHPEAGFTVGNAMGRNKLIYALADYGLVVSADHKKGGTWEGAVEELKRKPGRPVFVRMTGSVPVGNRKLVELGGVAFPGTAGYESPAGLLKKASAETVIPPEAGDLPLFTQILIGRGIPAMVREASPQEEKKPVEPPVACGVLSATIYEAVLPVIEAALSKPTSAAELATRLAVSKTQLEIWLKQAVSEKKVKKLIKPVRYARRTCPC
jgi:predicted Rossmann fold nucleotide-binding protein DprA/Smf involved in DNA uptake